jgi:hypothetical protein
MKKGCFSPIRNGKFPYYFFEVNSSFTSLKLVNGKAKRAAIIPEY